MSLPASMRLVNTVVAVAAATLMGVTAVQAETPVRGGTLTVGFPSDSKTMNPMFSVQFTERQVLYLVYNTLTKLVRTSPSTPSSPSAGTWKTAASASSSISGRT